MGLSLTTSVPPIDSGQEELYEIIKGQRVWPRVGERETDLLYELVDGQRKEVPRMGAFAGVLASMLAQFLNSHALPQQLGFALVEVLFQLAPGRPNRRPDVAFVRTERWPLTALPTEDPLALNAVPNLAVEIISPTNTATDTEEKLQDYFGAGVQLVWVVYPVLRRIYAYESLTQVRILTEKDNLDGGIVLPGFQIAIATLFASVVKPT